MKIDPETEISKIIDVCIFNPELQVENGIKDQVL